MGIKVEKTKKLSASMEDYLEAIVLMKQDNDVARVRDISRFMNVRKPSVTGALNVLSEKGLVVHERYGYVDLTREGEKLAQKVLKKHKMMVKFLCGILKIDHEIAAIDACKMEHSISPQTFKKLSKFIEFVETCPDGERPDWLKSFDRYFKTGRRPECRVRQIKRKAKNKK
ncbi:MAG: metal-dependent transcriptional regulator [Candidatus Omnitrophota bacterium]|nr:metal-dependent transcriptional regulator [Candidatus Omnitrophota bacterium]